MAREAFSALLESSTEGTTRLSVWIEKGAKAFTVTYDNGDFSSDISEFIQSNLGSRCVRLDGKDPVRHIFTLSVPAENVEELVGNAIQTLQSKLGVYPSHAAAIAESFGR